MIKTRFSYWVVFLLAMVFTVFVVFISVTLRDPYGSRMLVIHYDRFLYGTYITFPDSCYKIPENWATRQKKPEARKNFDSYVLLKNSKNDYIGVSVNYYHIPMLMTDSFFIPVPSDRFKIYRLSDEWIKKLPDAHNLYLEFNANLIIQGDDLDTINEVGNQLKKVSC